MAGDWIKFEKSTPDKPEVWGMADELGIDPDAVVGKLLRVWSWFDEQSEQGNAPSVSKSLLDRKVGVTGFCSAMVSCGWMVEEDSQVWLPNFDRHNGKTAKNRALTAKRVAQHKAKSNADGNDKVTHDALPREEKRREEVKKKNMSGKPDPLAIEVLEFLNQKTGKSYKAAKTNLEHINARIRDGYTLDQFKHAIEVKVADWKGTEMEMYLRPTTLFNSKKFDGYVNQPLKKRMPDVGHDQPTYDPGENAESHHSLEPFT